MAGQTINQLPLAVTPLTGSELVPLMQQGVTSSATTKNLATYINQQVSPFTVFNVLSYGAVGNGITDDTAALNTAIIAASGSTLWLPPGYTFLTTGITLTNSIAMTGGGTLKMYPGANSSALVTCVGVATVFVCDGITIDGNQANQTVPNTQSGLRFAAVGTSTQPAVFVVRNCSFINGAGAADIYLRSDQTRRTLETVVIENNRFFGGRENTNAGGGEEPRYIDISSPLDFIISGNVFDFLTQPVSFGKEGINAYDINDGAGAPDRHSGVITGNFFRYCGKGFISSSSGVIGSIDCYTSALNITISDNTIVNPIGRGIQTKADAENLAITGNAVYGGLILGPTQNPHIVVNGSVNANVKGNITITGNVSDGSLTDGLLFAGFATGSPALATNAVIANNTVISAAVSGIRVNNALDVVMTGNTITSPAADGIRIQNVDRPTITSNNITNAGTIGIEFVPTAAQYIVVANNNIYNPTRQGIYVNGVGAGLIQANAISGMSASAFPALRVDNVTGILTIRDNQTDALTPLGFGGGTSHPNLRMHGAFGLATPSTITANYTVVDTDEVIINNKSGSTATLTLPDPTNYNQRQITIMNYQGQNVQSSTANVILPGALSAASILTATVGKWALLQADTNVWRIVQSN